jgi:hypothetical protein
MKNAPNRSQGREEKMQAASFFAHCATVVKRLLVALAVYEMAPAALVAFLLRVLRLGGA